MMMGAGFIRLGIGSCGGAVVNMARNSLGDCQLLEKDSPVELVILGLQSTGYVGAAFSLR
jgi:hypothetical protein